MLSVVSDLEGNSLPRFFRRAHEFGFESSVLSLSATHPKTGSKQLDRHMAYRQSWIWKLLPPGSPRYFIASELLAEHGEYCTFYFPWPMMDSLRLTVWHGANEGAHLPKFRYRQN